ncbi:MAG: LamG-like jellyroll fold domain-containing protein [Bacteroidota bacterium]|nr:LamG-like jellyroll fold domain-containing protein [Bacteroidota bacterium]
MKKLLFTLLFASTFLNASLYAQSNPEFYLPCNGNAGDSSGHSWHGTISGNVQPRTDRFGRLDGALGIFSRTGNDWLNIPNTDILNSSIFTVSIWINLDTVPSSNQLQQFFRIGYNSSTSTNGTFLLVETGAGDGFTFQSATQQTGVNKNVIVGSNVMPIKNTWYHIVWTRDTSQTVLYVNNQIKGTATLTGAKKYSQFDISPTSTYIFGLSSILGRFDDTRYYKRVLSTTEIAALFNETHGGGTGTNELFSNDEIVLFPNPAKSNLTISYLGNTDHKQISVSVFDINGKVLFTDNAYKWNENLDISKLIPGIYFVYIISNDINVKKKFIVE